MRSNHRDARRIDGTVCPWPSLKRNDNLNRIRASLPYEKQGSQTRHGRPS